MFGANIEIGPIGRVLAKRFQRSIQNEYRETSEVRATNYSAWIIVSRGLKHRFVFCRSLPEINGLSKDTVLTSWMAKFDCIIKSERIVIKFVNFGWSCTSVIDCTYFHSRRRRAEKTVETAAEFEHGADYVERTIVRYVSTNSRR